MATQQNALQGSQKQKDDLPTFKAKVFRDFSQGTMRKLQNSMAPAGSYRLALNMDSDNETGSLVSRLGTSLVGTQRSAGYSCYGIGNYIRTESTGNKLFASFGTSSTNTVFDIVDGTKNLTGDTAGLKTRFCSFLDEIVRVNGTDSCKSYNNSAWITTGGAFDLANMPKFSIVIEWKERIFGAITGSDKLLFSSVADPTTRTVSWTSTGTDGAGYLMMSQEDGGGGLSALAKVPGYFLAFKQRTMKRWDGYSTYPEDLINQGVPSQECVCNARELVYMINQKGVWATNGGYPVRISRPVQDFIQAISDWTKVSCIGDDEHVMFSIGTVTIGLDTYSNVVLKYNIEDKTWDVRSYYNTILVTSRYTDSNGLNSLVFGDNNGQILMFDSGYTDYSSTVKPIFWTVETHQSDWGMRGNIKEVQRMLIYTENISTGNSLARNNSKDGSSYFSLGKIDKECVEINSPSKPLKGNYLQFKFTGVTDSEQVKFLGYEFPDKSTIYSYNTSE